MKFLLSAVAAFVFAFCAISARGQCSLPYCAPTLCFDVSGSATAQSCTTVSSNSSAVTQSTPLVNSSGAIGTVLSAGATIIYSTTTSNSGDLTIAINGGAAVHVKKWQGASVLQAGDLAANIPVLLTFDGTYWELGVPGNPPTGLTGAPWTMLTPSTITPPVMSGFTLASAGTTGFSSTYSANSAGAYWISETNSSSSVTNSAQLWYRPISGTFTLTAGFIPMCINSLFYSYSGIALRESATGKIISFDVECGTGVFESLCLHSFTSYTSGSTSYFGCNTNIASLNTPPIVWIQIVATGSTYTWSTSLDGQSWIPLHANALNNFFTTAADQAGFFVNGYVGNGTIAGLLAVDWSGL